MSAAARQTVLLGLHQQFGRGGQKVERSATDLVHSMLVPFYDEYPDEVNEGKLLGQMAPGVIAAGRTAPDRPVVATPSTSRAIRSASASIRCLALAFNCGALAPWKSHTFVPHRAGLRHCSPFFLCAAQRRSGGVDWTAWPTRHVARAFL
jgi:hypothetical protein